MTASVKFRLALFSGAIVAVGAMIGIAAHMTAREVHLLGQQWSSEAIESFRTADQFRADLIELDYRLLIVLSRNDVAEFDRFKLASKKLDAWIDTQRPLLTSEPERQILDKMNDAYDSYLAAAARLGTNVVGGRSSLADFDPVERESRRLLELNAALVGAHRGALTSFVAESQHLLDKLRRRLYGALGALLILGIGLAVVVYREMIAPLHVKLAESEATIARQEKLASLGVLAAGVAHEIRNPLTAIKARLFTQQKALRAGSPEHDDALIIGHEISRLEHIVRDVLQFARPDDPEFTVQPAMAPLREVCDLMAPELEKNHIKLVIEAVPAASIKIDLGQFKQVLINLVQNAAESIESGGVITLRGHTTSERLRGKLGPVVILEVRDTGHGIPPAVQQRLFDPFFSTKPNGTGLGLAIAARIVEKHGGLLTFETAVNRGTTFAIILPEAA